MRRAKMVRIVVLCVGALVLMALVAVGFANAGVDWAGTTAANFLSVGAGPRILGMGGATLGLGQDLAAGAWNPAALGWMGETSIVVSHAGLDNESLQEWAAVGGRFGKSGTRWSVSGLYQGDGSFEGRDASNNPTGSFSVSSFAVGGHVAQQLGSRITLGLGVKMVNEKLADVSGSGATFDGGLMFRQGFREGVIGAGIAVQNAGGTMKYPGATYDIHFPTSYGLGVAFAHPRTGLSLALDANFPNNYYKDFRTGLEWRWKDMVALRTGYRGELGASDDPLSGPTFGMGAGKSGFWFDYGFLLSGSGSSGQHRLALTFLPGQWSGLSSDPFGQGDIPRDWDDTGPRRTTPGPKQPPKTRP